MPDASSTFRDEPPIVLGMDSTSPPGERAVHYQEQADRLRTLAEAEPIESIRTQLLSAAQMYQELADKLRPAATKRRLAT